MNWHRLDREKTIDMINSVKSTGEALLFSPITSEAKCARLPFYGSHLFYRLTNFASMPVFSMDFIGDGTKFYYIDGSDKPLMEINRQFGITLTEDTVIPYLNFYFLTVRQEDGDVMMLKNASEAADIDMYDEERRENLQAAPPAAKPHFDSAQNCFVVEAPLYYAGSLLDAVLLVDREGHVTIKPKKMVMSGSPESTNQHTASF